MIRLRLQRKGRKKRPYYHLVVADQRFPRDGRIIEQLGRFDNVSEKKELILDEERVIHWLRIGAQPSDTVRTILKQEGILYRMHLIRWGKSEEEIEAAVAEWKEQRASRLEGDSISRKEQQKALLEAEEKEYRKQLEEEAAKAAKEVEAARKEKEKQEAEATKGADSKEEEEKPAEAAEEEQKAEEDAPEETSGDDAPKTGQGSTEMNANEAIDHIRNTSLDELKGFVTKDEDRVTVLRAWESKQSE
ncbi:MAG: 30S ribosomal protein S16 [Balneolaceae bacterium]